MSGEPRSAYTWVAESYPPSCTLVHTSSVHFFHDRAAEMPTASQDSSGLTTVGQIEYLAVGEVHGTDVPWYPPSFTSTYNTFRVPVAQLNHTGNTPAASENKFCRTVYVSPPLNCQESWRNPFCSCLDDRSI